MNFIEKFCKKIYEDFYKDAVTAVNCLTASFFVCIKNDAGDKSFLPSTACSVFTLKILLSYDMPLFYQPLQRKGGIGWACGRQLECFHAGHRVNILLIKLIRCAAVTENAVNI